MRHHVLIALLAGGLSFSALADVDVQMHTVDEQGQVDAIGTITISESEYGLVFTPQLEGLDQGLHGFHIHENPSCDPAESDGKMTAAGAAGGHYDPENTGKHGFPWGDGHLGDLPALYIDEDGKATQPVLAPRLKSLDDVTERSVMVHVGGDNHADHPKPLGGGGARMACGVISQ